MTNHATARLRRLPLSLVLLCAAAGLPMAEAQTTTQPASPTTEPQWWTGFFDAMGSKTDFAITFRPAEDGQHYSATLSIPVQGAIDLPVVDVQLTSSTVAFTIPGPAQAVFECRRSEDGQTAEGLLKQHGMEFPVQMRRVTETEVSQVGPPRPQTPQPPFPYDQRDVAYTNEMDDTALAGTLTIPKSKGRHPAVILITGSGPQDRDETLFGHKPFLVIADHLTRHGIAVLRVDDRGVGKSTGSTSQSTSLESAGDVLAGIKFLKRQPDIDPARIGLIGHSEGGLIAPLVAVSTMDVKCLIMLGGPGLPGIDILTQQMEAMLQAAKLPEDQIKKHLRAQRDVLDVVAKGGDEAAVREALRKLIMLQTAAAGDVSKEEIKAMVDLHLSSVNSPWMRWFIRHDPRGVLRLVRCPVLALGGSLDFQVPPKKSLPEIEAALKAGENPDGTVKELPGLNHLFQTAQTGMLAEYGTIEQTLAPQVLAEITTWLTKRFKIPESAPAE